MPMASACAATSWDSVKRADSISTKNRASSRTSAASPHAHALATLETKHKASDANCLKCHTTAFGREGGFQPGAAASGHPDLARVGCESCHGPGGEHVAAPAKKAAIVSLGDKCDS